MLILQILTWLYNFCLTLLCTAWGFPGGASGKEPACPCRRHKRRGFNSWAGKIPWRRAWRIPWTEGCKESDMTEATKQQQSTALWNSVALNTMHILDAKLCNL